MKVSLFYLPSIGSRSESERGLIPHPELMRSIEAFATRVLPRFQAP